MNNPATSNTPTEEKSDLPAGFWIRFAATWIDAAIIYLAVFIAEKGLNRFTIYVPFEITFLVTGLAYVLFFVAWKGRTPGKMLCGLTIKSMKDQRIGFVRTLLREVFGKVVSGLLFCIGFFWIGFTKTKRGWHDYIARTKVVRNQQATGRGKIALATVLIISSTWIAVKATQIITLYKDSQDMTMAENVRPRYLKRNSATLTEVSSLTQNDQKKFIDWLDTHGKTPADYAVEVAAQHQVTLFGEMHGQKEYLDFFNAIIPDLYHKAGVTCVAMEVCIAEDNDLLTRLVTAPEFDRELALQIARHNTWTTWGLKEYWDVFETVWKLNKSLPAGAKKMRVAGIDTRWDGPSLALIGLGDDGRKGPIWEKLRAIRCPISMLKLVKRDELMARNIVKEIIEKGERGIVWVGGHHAFANYCQPGVDPKTGTLVREMGRMAFMLHEKYADKIFDIRLHTLDPSPGLVIANYKGGEPLIGNFVETVMLARNNLPVGFTVEGSPFAMLRDSNSYYYHFQPSVAFSDLGSGYIFLKPSKDIRKCEWVDGFISKEMFMKHKPFYETVLNHPLKDAEEADRLMKEN